MLVPTLQNINEKGDQGKADPLAGNQKLYALNLTGFLIIYGYFAFGFADDFATCYANDESEKRIEEDKVTKTDQDVSANLRFGFLEIFICTIVQALGLVLNHIFIDDNIKRSIALWAVIVPSIVWGLVSWCYLFVHRLNHAGEVCSGDFLKPKDIHEGYLIDTGLFIIFIWRLSEVFILVVGGFFLFCFACTVHEHQRQATRPRGGGLKDWQIELFFAYGISWAVLSIVSVIVITCLMVQDFSILFH